MRSPSGSFATINDLPNYYWIDYNYQGGNQIAAVVPEPSTLALAAAGAAGLGWRRVRRKWRS